MTEDQAAKISLDSLKEQVRDMVSAIRIITGSAPKSIYVALPASANNPLLELGGDRSRQISCESGEEPEALEWSRVAIKSDGTWAFFSAEPEIRPATEEEVLKLAQDGSESRRRYWIPS